MKIRRDRFRRTFTEANDRHGTFRDGKKTIRRHLAEHVTNLCLRSRAQHAVRRQIGRMKIVQILRFRPSQHFDDLPRTDLLVHVMHAAADGPSDIRDVNGFKRIPAVCASSHACAVITDGRSPGLTEIPGHILVQTIRGTAITDHGVEQTPFRRTHDLLLFGGQTLVLIIRIKQPSPRSNIRFVPQQRAPARLAVAPRTTGLLIVRFDRFRHIMVDHITHVRLVDSHAERIRGNHHRHTVGYEITLRPLPRFSRHTAMIGDRDHAKSRRILTFRGTQLVHGDIQRFGKRLHFLAGRAIHDAGFVRMIRNI